MARMYDIAERLKHKNEKPFIRIDEHHSYKIDTSVAKGFAVMNLSKKAEKAERDNDDGYDPEVFIYETIEIALGSEALEYIKSQEITMDALSLIMDAITAAYAGKDLPDEKEDGKEKAKGKKSKK